MPLVGSLLPAMVVARDLPANGKQPRACEPPILVVSDTSMNHQENFLQRVIHVCDRDTQSAQRAPHEIRVTGKDSSDLSGQRLVVLTLHSAHTHHWISRHMPAIDPFRAASGQGRPPNLLMLARRPRAECRGYQDFLREIQVLGS